MNTTFTDFILLNDIDENLLEEWLLSGCAHPAPPEVMEAKCCSGLTWIEFTTWLEDNIH